MAVPVQVPVPVTDRAMEDTEQDPYVTCVACWNPKCKAEPGSFALKLCGKCRAAQYCSRDCQAAHWASHRPVCTNASGQFPRALVTEVYNVFRGFVTLALFPGMGRGLVAAAAIPTGTEFLDYRALAMFVDDLAAMQAFGEGRLHLDPTLLHDKHAARLSMGAIMSFATNTDLEDAMRLNNVMAAQMTAWHRGAPICRWFGWENPEGFVADAQALIMAASRRAEAGLGPRDGSPPAPQTALERLPWHFMAMEPEEASAPCVAAEAIARVPPKVWEAVDRGRACVLANGFSLSNHTPRQSVVSVPFSLMNNGCGSSHNIMITGCRLPMIPSAAGSHAMVTLACMAIAWPEGGPQDVTSKPAPCILPGQQLLTTYRDGNDTAESHREALADYGIACGCTDRDMAKFKTVTTANSRFMAAWASRHVHTLHDMTRADHYFSMRYRALRKNAEILATVGLSCIPETFKRLPVESTKAIVSTLTKRLVKASGDLRSELRATIVQSEALLTNVVAFKKLQTILPLAALNPDAPFSTQMASGGAGGGAGSAGAGAGADGSAPFDEEAALLLVGNF